MQPKWTDGLFQTRLLTAVVLMFAAGGLIWANTRPQRFSEESYYRSNGGCCSTRFIGMRHSGIKDTDLSANILTTVKQYGWPYTVLSQTHEESSNQKVYPNSAESLFSFEDCLFNALVAIGILFAVWLLSECCLRIYEWRDFTEDANAGTA